MRRVNFGRRSSQLRGQNCTPVHSTAPSLWQRVYDYARFLGTEIIFFDEIQHLDHQVANSEATTQRALVLQSTAATDTLKTILIRGLVPIVFVGITEARNMLFCDSQLAGRCLYEIDFSPLKPDAVAERKIFMEYCGMVGLSLRLHGLFEEDSDLISGDVPSNIHEVASGRLGMASSLILQGSLIANERQARRLEREDLSNAVDNWAIPLGIIDYNPFRLGIRARELRPAA